MLNTNNIVPSPNSDIRKLIFSGTPHIILKKSLSQKCHIFPIEIGVFGHMEYEQYSPEREIRQAKIDIRGYPHIILKKSLSQKGYVCPIGIWVFGHAE